MCIVQQGSKNKTAASWGYSNKLYSWKRRMTKKKQKPKSLKHYDKNEVKMKLTLPVRNK